jgi:hypothetical protein
MKERIKRKHSHYLHNCMEEGSNNVKRPIVR